FAARSCRVLHLMGWWSGGPSAAEGCGGESPQLWRSVDVYASPTANPVGAKHRRKDAFGCRDSRVILLLMTPGKPHLSVHALAALSVGPASTLASGQSSGSPASPNPEPPTTTEHIIVLSSGAEGRHVKLLQQALGGVHVDGVFGPETEEAVRAFQTSRGLSVDGVV